MLFDSSSFILIPACTIVMISCGEGRPGYRRIGRWLQGRLFCCLLFTCYSPVIYQGGVPIKHYISRHTAKRGHQKPCYLPVLRAIYRVPAAGGGLTADPAGGYTNTRRPGRYRIRRRCRDRQQRRAARATSSELATGASFAFPLRCKRSPYTGVSSPAAGSARPTENVVR